ncbi:hypothetical protein GCM10011409_21340 [Lentibacillus populi]|uniref:DnaD domain-containing protein n=1 Tax=Lentibacillus populi TaxID=1827502 RepID=A0A9W5TXJ0_9BACI|nr:hypothetical protein [Lentibacillus populi]GGB43461.1 hypothetical protein GCM10011409_21340 [Lentibacillus populi]
MKGYIKDFRKELNSDIWVMPPLYHRVWQYLKYTVNHKDNKVPMRDGSFLTIKQGQHLTSMRKIARQVGYYEQGAWKEPNPKTIKAILNWLETQNMISVSSGDGNNKYTLITLINWEMYQSEKEDGNSKYTVDTQSMDINKNDKECNKNDKEKDYTSKIKDLLPVFSSIPDFNQLNKKYWDVIRETRKTGKVSKSVIYNTMNKWQKYDPVVIEYALRSHIDMHSGKKEEYTIGIMRNTSKDEAQNRMNQKNKSNVIPISKRESQYDDYDYGF